MRWANCLTCGDDAFCMASCANCTSANPPFATSVTKVLSPADNAASAGAAPIRAATAVDNTIFRIVPLSLKNLPKHVSDGEGCQSGANRMLLHVLNKRLDIIIAADLSAGFIDETGGTGPAHG